MTPNGPRKGLCMCVSASLTLDRHAEGVRRLPGFELRRMAKGNGRQGQVVPLREAVDGLVLAQPQLVELSAEQERETVRQLAYLFTQAADRSYRRGLREAA
jgi:hypothetical protein